MVPWRSLELMEYMSIVSEIIAQTKAMNCLVLWLAYQKLLHGLVEIPRSTKMGVNVSPSVSYRALLVWEESEFCAG